LSSIPRQVTAKFSPAKTPSPNLARFARVIFFPIL
jgi:hypothetical protein